MSRQSQNIIWTYFKRGSEGDNKFAKCYACGKYLSYKTTVTNLKTHLKQKHVASYNAVINGISGPSNIMVVDESPDLGLGINKKEICTPAISDEESNDSGHQSTDILSYFEQETGGRVRCIVCRASRSNNPDELKNHLREKHPKLIGAIGQDVPMSDASGNEEDGTYTEVIYLEEGSKKKPKYVFKKDHKSRKSEHKITMKAKHRRLSSSSDDMPIKKPKQDDISELDTFLTYIRCLMRQVPNDVCAKLQMDIINLIVNAKLNKSNSNDVNILETSMGIAKDTMDRTGVITVTELPVGNLNTMDSVEHCYVEAAVEKTDN